jgi:hypothetical protein
VSLRQLAWLTLFLGGCAVVRRVPFMTAADVEPAPMSAPATVEAAEPPTPVTTVEPSTPTWTAIYTAYLGPGTVGACARSSACHGEAMRDPASAYRWLTERGYIDGPRSALVSSTNSCLEWFGGNMPPNGRPSEEARRDLRAWAAAGAAEN